MTTTSRYAGDPRVTHQADGTCTITTPDGPFHAVYVETLGWIVMPGGNPDVTANLSRVGELADALADGLASALIAIASAETPTHDVQALVAAMTAADARNVGWTVAYDDLDDLIRVVLAEPVAQAA